MEFCSWRAVVGKPVVGEGMAQAANVLCASCNGKSRLAQNSISSAMKYVIVQPHGIDFEFAITFPEPIQHCQAINLNQVKVVAAGFFKRETDGTVKAWGRSASLNVRSRGEEDAMLILFSESMPSIQEVEA